MFIPDFMMTCAPKEEPEYYCSMCGKKMDIDIEYIKELLGSDADDYIPPDICGDCMRDLVGL